MGACRRRAGRRRCARPSARPKGRCRRARGRAPAGREAKSARVSREARRRARASSELERRKPEQHEHHGDDPEAHHHLALLPSLELIVMVERRHAEDALAAAVLEVQDLDHHRERLGDEHAAHDEQHDLLAHDHHHYELEGWKESQVVVRFWIITMMLVLFGLSTLKLRGIPQAERGWWPGWG